MSSRSLIPAWGISLVVILVMTLGGFVSAAQLIHDTQTEFASGAFYQTVLEGTEMAPEILLDSYTDFSWSFEDDDISGWTFLTRGQHGDNVAEESPEGQIHLRARYASGDPEAYAYASRNDVVVPNGFVVEYLVYFDALEASGVADPMVEQPTGACQRFDIINLTAGFRMDVFTDRMVSFYREGTTGVNYPTIAYFDVTTNIGQWYTLRFEVNFDDPSMAVQVYRDGGWIGELKADTRNASSNTIRQLAYSRGSLSGLVETHIDYVKLGTEMTVLYSTGTYTSEILDLGTVSSFGALSWTEIPASPYPWTSWVKYAGNPIVSGPALVENILCDIDDPLQQPILYDGKYWMCYATGSTINLAYTTDPELLSWTKYEGNPVLSPGAGESYVFSPNIFRDGATYYLFYDVSLSVDGRQRVAYATASAPIGPYTKGQMIVDRGAPGEWDDYRVSEPFVFKDGDTYYLYYMGDHVCSGCNEQIGLATTTAALFPLGPESGGLWTKHGLILPHNPDPTGWDRGLTADPSVVKVGGTIYMRYTGSYANEHWQLGTAWSDDHYGPWNRPPGPDITLGPPGSWDDDRLVRGAIHYHNGKWYSPYTGGNGGYQGGMASADPVTSENLITFETRTSPDGSTWEGWQSVENGDSIQSTPNTYFQYRGTFNASLEGFSPTLTSATINYEGGLVGQVSLLPSFQTDQINEVDTLWIHLDGSLVDIEAATFKITYDENYVTPDTVIDGPDLPDGNFVDYTIYPQDSILIDIGILMGDFDGPGSLVGIVLTADALVDTTRLDFERSTLRDPENLDIPHTTLGAAIQISDVASPTVLVTSPASGDTINYLPTLTIDFSDDVGLNRGYYQIDSCTGAWTELWSYNSGRSDTTIDWTVPAVSEGTHNLYFKVTDDAGNSNDDTCSYSWTLTYDITSPDPPSGFTVEPGHEKCKLSWTNPTGDPSFAGVEIRRNPWCVGAYPEYDDSCAEIGYPADETEGDLVYQGTAESYRDSNNTTTMPRNVYYYSIFSYDAVGNYSTATSAEQGRATNYWLGDVPGDGEVYFEDLTILSNAFWTSDEDSNYDPEFDIGPTYNMSPKGIPTTDNVIDFEDLVVFAINFAAVSPNLKIAPLFADQDVSGPLALSLVMPTGDLEVGKEFKVKVLLRNNPGTVKSIHLVLPYDPSQLEFVRVDRSDGLKDAPCPVFFDGREMDHQVDVSLALLGGEISIGGSGEIASITFRLLEERDLSLSFSLIDLRDGENHKLSAEQEDAEYEATSQLPSSYGLSQNYPNPYNPQTQIAYQLPEAGEVSLKIYNIRGELVRTLVAEYKPAGHHTVMWDGRNEVGMDVASGIYFYRMVSGDFSATRKMVMIK